MLPKQLNSKAFKLGNPMCKDHKDYIKVMSLLRLGITYLRTHPFLSIIQRISNRSQKSAATNIRPNEGLPDHKLNINTWKYISMIGWIKHWSRGLILFIWSHLFYFTIVFVFVVLAVVVKIYILHQRCFPQHYHLSMWWLDENTWHMHHYRLLKINCN